MQKNNSVHVALVNGVAWSGAVHSNRQLEEIPPKAAYAEGDMKAALVIGVYLALRTVCTRLPTDCLSLEGPCISPDLCKSEEILLRNICDANSGRCQMRGSDCNVTVQAVFARSPLWKRDCVCAEEDPCGALQLLASLCRWLLGDGAPGALDEPSAEARQEPSRDVHVNLKLKAEWKSSRLSGYVPDPDASCLQMMKLCVQDEVCNRHLVPFIRSCSRPGCEDTPCRLATRRFYSGLPRNVAEMLAFCRCMGGEQDCEQVQATLQSTTCSGDQVVLWSCLEMLDSCIGDALCRQTFEAFLTKCFGPEETPSSEYSTTDLIHVIDLHYFLSEDQDCRMASLATLGSVLQSPCTCQMLYHHDLYKCNLLQQAVQNRSHFRLYGAKRNVSLQSQVNQSDPDPSQSSDQLRYFLLYIFVVVVILTAAAVILHTLGRRHSSSKKARFNPPQDSTKSFVQ